MVSKLDQVEQSGTKNRSNMVDILLALALLREQLAAKKVLAVDFPLDDFGVNSYMPYMNFLQNREYETVRRFLLVHPTAVAGSQWDIAGNGVCTQNLN